ncbi:hypothetical protein CUN85_07590 [Methanolobus halotolerans]|uniref:Uncharacterized protein n=1 Tax=Methanolobus halotolerans TaxID=2052935 RepID=A0A4E0PX75_9EURY|nr:hypothetical protein CUN85_07590 [Methanolobus halotolerans]
MIDLIIEYSNAKQPDGLGEVVVGGYVYRGSDIPEFEGRYVFAEWNRAGADGNGIIFIATPPRREHHRTNVGFYGTRGSLQPDGWCLYPFNRAGCGP